MRPARRAALLVLLAPALACAGDRVFECSEDEQCVLGGVAGRCEPSGYCSLPDGSCPDGFRYVEEAPDSLAGTCVGEVIGGCTEDPCEGCALAVAAGASHSCAILAPGTVHCWGENGDLQLGSSGGSSAAPRPVEGVTGAVELAAGDRHTCATLVDSGAVVCWGANDRGQLGTGTTGASALPGDPVVDSELARSLTAGGAHSCAIDDDTNVWCWGDNQFGQVSADAADIAAFPEDSLTFFDSAVLVAAGGRHSAAVIDDDSVTTWGEESSPALGRGDPAPSDPYSIVVDAFDARGSISAGAEHTCAVGTDRGVRCWGTAGDGRLGLEGGDRYSPADIGLDADQVRAGGRHTCALDGDALRCWGANDAGQLGADGASGPDPREVAGSWLAVASGGEHTCAIAGDRTVRCWGDNGAGQLGREGDGSSDPSTVALPCP
ncbi:MAG TPA: hypothetical protein VFU21_04735 [Kofleriaceae bacterium]|nr:hypothetical protein [Kofleriaceae bacterium]